MKTLLFDSLFILILLVLLGTAMILVLKGDDQEPPPVTCDCKADVDATAQNCVDAYAVMSEDFDQKMQLLFNALEACIWLEEEGYAAVEDTPIGDRKAWRDAMNKVDEAEIYKDSVWMTYHDFYGEADLWDL